MSGSGSSSSTSNTSAAKPTVVGTYQLTPTHTTGTFQTMFKLARDLYTGHTVLIQTLNIQPLRNNRIINLINRNLSTLKKIRHPNVVRVYEVMASDTKLYIVLESVTGGELLFDKIKSSGRLTLTEPEARKYFQQLISALACCHSQGVSHGNLKLDNLLVDAEGVLKVSDFGMSIQKDGQLHTPSYAPHYMAPEVVSIIGCDSVQGDIWSCGIILFVLLAGYLPFTDKDDTTVYLKTCQANFTCPSSFSASVSRLIKKILNPNPATRITINDILEDEWYKNEHQPVRTLQEIMNSDDLFCPQGSKDVAGEGQVALAGPAAPVTRNALKKSLSSLNHVGNLFNKVLAKRETNFMSKCSANEIISGIEHAVVPMGFNVNKRKYKLRIEGEQAGRKGHLSISTKIIEADPPFHSVEIRKTAGDTMGFDKFYKDLSAGLQDIIWKEEPDDNTQKDD